MAGSSKSRKTKLLFDPTSGKQDIDKIYLYAENPYEAKHPLVINIHKITDLEDFNDPKAFIE